MNNCPKCKQMGDLRQYLTEPGKLQKDIEESVTKGILMGVVAFSVINLLIVRAYSSRGN